MAPFTYSVEYENSLLLWQRKPNLGPSFSTARKEKCCGSSSRNLDMCNLPHLPTVTMKGQQVSPMTP
eukprot:CCRYP_002814-RB/>CCRYP_002814-RB protein AED:0.47 eAED:1.00 QI:0/-1/0/1/-1/0/1/0/66